MLNLTVEGIANAQSRSWSPTAPSRTINVATKRYNQLNVRIWANRAHIHKCELIARSLSLDELDKIMAHKVCATTKHVQRLARCSPGEQHNRYSAQQESLISP